MNQNMPIVPTYMKKHLQSIPIFKNRNGYFIPFVQTNNLKRVYFGERFHFSLSKCPSCDEIFGEVMTIS